MPAKYKFLFVLFIFTSFSRLHAQNELSGTIKDLHNGLFLRGATVYIPDLHTGAFSDSTGKYRIRNLPSGTYLVKTTIIGYATQVEYINFRGEIKKNYILVPSSTELKDVVVTGVI